MYIASEGKVNMLTSGFIVGNHTAYSIFLWVTNSKSNFLDQNIHHYLWKYAILVFFSGDVIKQS